MISLIIYVCTLPYVILRVHSVLFHFYKWKCQKNVWAFVEHLCRWRGSLVQCTVWAAIHELYTLSICLLKCLVTLLPCSSEGRYNGHSSSFWDHFKYLKTFSTSSICFIFLGQPSSKSCMVIVGNSCIHLPTDSLESFCNTKRTFLIVLGVPKCFHCYENGTWSGPAWQIDQYKKTVQIL